MESFITVMAAPAAMISYAAGLTWFIASQFSGIRSLIHSQNQKTQDIVLSKLEYHERHDDQRFAAISNDLWAIRVRNAAVDGIELKK